MKTTATVCLLNATRVPGHYAKLVRSHVRSGVTLPSLVLFEPDSSLYAVGALVVESSVEQRGPHPETEGNSDGEQQIEWFHFHLGPR